jgi:hypothetical protein
MSLLGKIWHGVKHIARKGKNGLKILAGKLKQGSKFVHNVIEKVKGGLAQAGRIPVIGNVIEAVKQAFPQEVALLKKGVDVTEQITDKVGDISEKIEKSL